MVRSHMSRFSSKKEKKIKLRLDGNGWSERVSLYPLFSSILLFLNNLVKVTMPLLIF